MREDWNGGKQAAPFPDPANGALYWCCYAWPVEHGVTGGRAFFVNQEGIVLQCDNDGAAPFSGVGWSPWFGDAFRDRHDMSSGLRIGPPRLGPNATTWTVVP